MRWELFSFIPSLTELVPELSVPQIFGRTFRSNNLVLVCLWNHLTVTVSLKVMDFSLFDSCYFAAVAWIFPSPDELFWDFFILCVCGSGLVYKNCLHLFLLWNGFLSLSTAFNSFAGSSSLIWQLWSLRASRRFIHFLLAFRVSIEKPAFILMGPPLYMTWSFPPCSF